jgi:anthranilate synthase component 2
MKPILMLDNYDSFTYNIVHYVEALGVEVEVFRNDKITLEEVGNYDTIILSPGPGLPKDAGILKQVIEKYGASKKILGVCLGHQAIAEVYGGSIFNLDNVYHGVASECKLETEDKLFSDLESTFDVGRYHSWSVTESDLPECFDITARSTDDMSIMGIKHKTHNVRGVQFHPESVLTPNGMKIIRNWVKNC